MQASVDRLLRLLCAVVAAVPVGTKLGVVYLWWMLVSGRLLQTRGAVLPGLSRAGLPDALVRRAWAAVGQGRWTIAALLTRWQGVVAGEAPWQPHAHDR